MDTSSELNKSSGLIERRKVTHEHKITIASDTVVTLREFNGAESITNAVLIPAFPTTSITAILTAGYLRDTLKLPLIGCISSPHFPPRCVVENGIPSHAVRIFGNSSIVVITSEFKLPTAELMAAVSELLLYFVARHSISLVCCVEGAPTDTVSAEDSAKLHFVSTDAKFATSLQSQSHEPLTESIVGGLSGLLLAEAPLRDLNVAVMVAATSSKYPDARSAVHCVRALDKFLDNVTIDTGPLEEKANALAASVKQLLSKDEQLQQDAAANTRQMYI